VSHDLVPYREGVTLIASLLQGIVRAYRQSRAVSASQIELLRIEAKKTEVLARIGAKGEIARANIAEIMATLDLINSYPSASPAVPLLMDELEHLHRTLRRHLDDF
jgi:hypothetical protein